MKVICIGDPEFDELLAKVIEYVDSKLKIEEKWISPEETMRRLGIKSKTTLQKLRDGGKIRYSQPQKRIILYDAVSINEFLELHANK